MFKSRYIPATNVQEGIYIMLMKHSIIGKFCQITAVSIAFFMISPRVLADNYNNIKKIDCSVVECDNDSDFGNNVRNYLLSNPEVILEVFAILEGKEKEKKSQISRDLIGQYEQQLFSGDDPRKGAEEPAVKFVEFFDYRCTYCKRVFPEVSALLDSRADVAAVMKEFPILGPQSEAASRTALAVRALHGDAAYLKIHDAFMGHTGEFTDRDLARLVETAGFDPVAVQSRSQGDDIAEVIRANRSLAAKLGINGTPAFVFEDSIAPGMMSYDQIANEVDRIASKKSTQ